MSYLVSRPEKKRLDGTLGTWLETYPGNIMVIDPLLYNMTICEELWPIDRMKHLKVHDLRHSNAIWLLENNMQLYQVAQHLGNSAAVVETYFSC